MTTDATSSLHEFFIFTIFIIYTKAVLHPGCLLEELSVNQESINKKLYSHKKKEINRNKTKSIKMKMRGHGGKW
jgi:hypothetical protein